MAATVTVDFNANLARFSSSIDKATNDLNKFQSNTARIAGNIKSAFGILGTGFVIAGLGAAIKDVANFADEMGKSAQKSGTTAQSFSELAYAAKLADADVGTLEKGLVQLSAKLNDAKNGSKEAKELFKELKIDPKQFTDSAEAMKVIADRFNAMPDGDEKTATARKIGKAWVDLIPLLNDGSKGLKSAAEEAKKFGVVVDDAGSKAAQDFNDNISRMETSLQGLKIQLVSEAVPAFAAITAEMVEATKQGGILHGTLIGLREAWAFAFGLDADSALKEQYDKTVAELEKQRAFANKLRSTGKFTDPFGFEWGANTEAIAAAEAKLKSLQRTATGLKEMLDPRPFATKLNATGTPTDPAGNPKSNGRLSVDRDAEAAKRFVESLTKEAATLGMTGTALKAYEAAHLKLTPAQQAVVTDTLKKIDAFNQEAESLKSLNEMLENHQQVMDDFNERELQQIEQDSSDEASKAEDFERQAQAIREMLDPAIALYNELGKIQSLGSLGLLDSEEVEAASKKIQEEFDKLAAKTDETADAITEFWKQAAANMQDAMADFFFDAMQGKLSDLAGSFKATIDRMVANLMASQLLNFLTGEFGKTGVMGGVLGDIFGSLPKFATGTDYVPRDMVAVIHKGEKIVPAAQNRPGASGGGSSVVYMTVNTPDANSFRKSNQQIASDLQRALNGARRVS